MICFRVTRKCNARCQFCLAPPEGACPDLSDLIRRLEWLLSHKVKMIHFCGGEPTIYPDLEKLISFVHENGGKVKMTTNGIGIADSLISLLYDTRAEVKVSLHGSREHHDSITGVRAFDHTVANIKRLVKSGVKSSVQSTIIAEKPDMVHWLSDFCLDAGVRRLSILPFIPRGKGSDVRDRFELSSIQRRQLKDIVKAKRRKLNTRLDLRWLDFNTKQFHVVEADGRIILEEMNEKRDKVLYEIP